MTNNPYAQVETYDSGYSDPPRVSGLAVTSFVLSLICCIPGLGLIGAILGGVSLVGISQSGGRKSGRGLAVAGLVIGLLVTLLWVGGAVGVLKSMSELDVYGNTLRAVDQRDYTAVRQMLTPATSSAVSDERLEEFRAAIEAEWGSYQRMPSGLGDWFSSYSQVMQKLANQQQQSQGMSGSVLPLPVYYDNGLTLSMFEIDPGNVSPAGAAQASNIAVFDQQGAPIWLLPPGGTTPPVSPQPAPPPTEAPGEAPTEEPGETPGEEPPAEGAPPPTGG